ncbi:MAG: sulfite exporter TauE/SafE family protein, partial [Deltaproteobacteria bacterium]|nr:sulfite exporter TauE/SafE family protein [Deltaproteobacteria bacterium]
MDLSVPYVLLLIGTGFVAGVINTLAGGGTNLTLPALMVMGMPADVANATNRVGVLLQSAVALSGFRRHDRLPTDDIGPILLPTLVGGLAGASAAAFAPVSLLKPLLLSAMVGMTIIMLVRPEVIVPPAGTEPHRVKDRPASRYWLFLAGAY